MFLDRDAGYLILGFLWILLQRYDYKQTKKELIEEIEERSKNK